MISIFSAIVGCAIGYGIARVQIWCENFKKRAKGRNYQDDNAKMSWPRHG